jgi:hypothetical protein
MGSGRDKRKKAKPKAPGQGVEKTAQKTLRNEQRRETRATKKAAVRPCSQQASSPLIRTAGTNTACCARSAGRRG